MRIYRLAPDADCETYAPGIGIGGKTSDEDWANVRPGAWIETKVGDEVRLSPGAVELRMLPTHVGTRHMNSFQGPKDAADLWSRFVTERMAREAPLPTGAADREQLMRRLVRDLFDKEPSETEIAAYVADKSPGALHPALGLDLLKTRVLHGRKISHFSGTLPPGEITFKVLAADLEAAKRARVATGPGYYILGDKQRLQGERSGKGSRWKNKATISFFSKPKPQPYTIALPDGRETCAIAWDRDAGALWITQVGLVRSYDFSNSDQVRETRYETGGIANVPERFREALKGALNISRKPVRQQSSADSKGGVRLEPAIE